MKRLGKVKLEWSPNFAYAVGLIATDGNLSPDGRHLHLTSKDEELAIKFCLSLGIENKIGRKARGGSKEKRYYVVQFSDKNFYEFLLDIGLMPAKSKRLKSLKVPTPLFKDFLRGCIDGDGNISYTHHPESKHLQLRVRLCSASFDFLSWIKEEITNQLEVKGGWIYHAPLKSVFSLSYGKSDSGKILQFMYHNKDIYYLDRKYLLAKRVLGE